MSFARCLLLLLSGCGSDFERWQQKQKRIARFAHFQAENQSIGRSTRSGKVKTLPVELSFAHRNFNICHSKRLAGSRKHCYMSSDLLEAASAAFAHLS